MTVKCIQPRLDCHPRVRALVTTRAGGVSRGGYADLNLGDHVGDDAAAVRENRTRLEAISAPCFFVRQVHGSDVVEARADSRGVAHIADALWTRECNLAIAILTADCFPLLLASTSGSSVGLAHCGWRGLVAGVVARLVAAMPAHPGELRAWIGPGISAPHYEVGEVFVEAVRKLEPESLLDGVLVARAGRTHANLERLIRNQLAHLGVACAPDVPPCSFADTRFFSHRRDGPATGRFASLVWIDPEKTLES